MDVSLPIRNAKNQKLGEEHDVDEGTTISSLPDSLLQYILSFLPTEDAVKTSVLSRRWEYLWMSVPVLDFKEGAPGTLDIDLDEEALAKRTLFMNSVERVLLLRDSLTVTKFSLSCNVLGDWPRINAWISAAVLKHKVHAVDLCLKKVGESFELPCCLFTCESLQLLNLEMKYYLELPSFACSSSLKTLTLTGVIFPGDETVKQLFAVCVVLEELSLICCSWEHVKAAFISGPRLKKLSIIERYSVYPDDTDGLSYDPDNQSTLDGCQFVICGANLTYFSYDGNFGNDYFLFSSSSMVNAFIHVDFGGRRTCYRAFKLLRGLSNARSLHLTERSVKALAEDAEELFAHLPEFCNLNHFQSDWMLLFKNREELLTILQKLPCLSSLKLNGHLSLFRYYGKNDWTLDPLPACFYTHLKTLEISWFYGSDYELYGVKILLESASILERMVISFNPREFEGDFKKQQEVRERIISFPRASRNCVITAFCPS